MDNTVNLALLAKKIDNSKFPTQYLNNNIPTNSPNINLGSILNTGSSVLTGLMNPSGVDTTVGNIMQGVGSVVSNIPGIGGIIGAGVNVLGGLVNAAFGSKINTEFVNQTRNNIDSYINKETAFNTTNDVLSEYSSNLRLNNVNKKDVGKDGWFSNKASKLTKQLNNEIDASYGTRLGILHADTQNLMDELENNIALNTINSIFAKGGQMNTHGGIFSNNVTTVNNGGTHESNPNEGVMMGIDNNGIPNLVEQGETIYNNYVFSNRIKVPKNIKDKYKLKGDTFSDVAKYIQKESEERPNDPISKKGLEANMNRLMLSQEEIRNKSNKKNINNKYSYGSYLRYAPVLGSTIGVMQNLLSSPDYSGVEAIKNAANEFMDYNPVKYTPINNYLTYKPLDTDYYINKLNAQTGATKRTIMNQGNRAATMAGLLASDYNYGNQLGNLSRQAEEYNLAQKERVESFNRQTNEANSNMDLRVALANQEALNRAKSQRLSGLLQSYNMKDVIDNRRSASLNANLTNLFDSLGNIGKEEFTKDMIKNNPALLYDWLGRYKNEKKSKGGYLTVKKRRK